MKKIRFGDLLYIKGRIGWQRLQKKEYLLEGEYYLVTGVDIDNYCRINFQRCYYVSKERYDQDPNIQLKNGDIILTKDGTIGKIGIIENLDKPATLNSHLFLIRNMRPDILDTNFLFYILKSDHFQKFALYNTTGSNIPAFTQENISQFEIELPDIKIQREIASFVKNIDQIILNNKKMNMYLESMSKLIYDYWFVQFDFPDENGRPYKSSGGKMVWNEELKREIPEGWSSKTIGEIEKNIVTGKTPSTKNKANFDGIIPFVTIGDIRDNIYITKTEQYLSYTGAETQKNKYIPEDSLCVTCIATPGLLGFTTKTSQTNQQINSIVFENQLHMFYLYFALKNYFQFSSGAKTGNTFSNMNKEEFSNILVVNPSNNILSLFHKNISTYFKMLKNISKENSELTSLRDFLLPMLMNGQVTIKDQD